MKLLEKFLVLSEQREDVIVLILTRDEESLGHTGEAIKEYCDGNSISCHFVFSDLAFIASREKDKKLVIHNFDGGSKKLTLDPLNTMCFVRGSILENEAGKTIFRGIEEAEVFMVNSSHVMELSRNKLLSGLHFEKNNILTPRTVFINNEESIKTALKKIGGKFPLILKTISGAEGIGVIKVETRESLPSILQALWKHDAEILLQEYIPIKFDIRTLVLNKEVLGSTKRLIIKDDFRTNLSLGAKTVPYQLSEKEEEVVLKVAKSMNGYFLGVDHILDGYKIFVLEVNGSPGSRSKFGDSDGKPLSRKNIVEKLITSGRDKSTWRGYRTEQRGASAKIKLEEIGKTEARLDTGNESHNVLHAENMKMLSGGRVQFETINGIILTKKIVDKQLINTGGGNTERRPVIILDLSIGKTKYKNAKFTLADRSENDFPVLIGRKFLSRADISVSVNDK